METIKVVGTSFDGRQENLRNINTLTDSLIVKREPENPFDSNAIHVYVEKNSDSTQRLSCGYLPKEKAAVLAPLMDAGKAFIVESYLIVGNLVNKSKNIGLRIQFSLQ